jgi:hypothetical protein
MDANYTLGMSCDYAWIEKRKRERERKKRKKKKKTTTTTKLITFLF